MKFYQCHFTRRFFDLGDQFYTPVTATGLRSPYWVHLNQDVHDSSGELHDYPISFSPILFRQERLNKCIRYIDRHDVSSFLSIDNCRYHDALLADCWTC